MKKMMACFAKVWIFQKTLEKVKLFALTLLLCLIILPGTFILCTVYVYRYCVIMCAKINRKDLSIIGLTTSVYASDDLYGIPNRNIICTIKLKGNLGLEDKKTIEKKILSLRDVKNLRRYPAKFRNYLFWKDEEEEDFQKKIIFLGSDNNRIWTEQDLQEMQRNLIRKQWSRFSSPWEILLLPNYRTEGHGHIRSERSLLLLRFHKCIENEMKHLVKVLCNSDRAGDVFGTRSCVPDVCSSPKSPIKLVIPSSQVSPSKPRASATIVNVFGKHFSKAIQKIEVNPVSPSHQSQATFHRTYQKFALIFRKIFIPFRMPFDFAEQIMELSSHTGPSNEWEVEERSLLKKDHVVVLDRFSVQHVKDIKNMLGVTFSTVLIAALSSALRVTFIEAGLKLPHHMKVMLPLSPNSDTDLMASGNGEKDKSFGNGSICWINLPLGVSSSRERLRCCESELKKLHKSTRLISNKVLLKLIGLLPFKYHWYFLRRRPWAGVMINLKGPNETLCDHQVEDVILSSASDSGFVLSFVSYADYLRISLVIDYRLVPNEAMAKNLLKNIYAELVLLGIDGTATV